MKYIYIVFILLLYLQASYAGNKKVVSGEYRSKHSPHVFILSEDSTFKYKYYGVWYKESSGTWKNRDNIIYLNSYNQIDKIPVEYSTISVGGNKSAVIHMELNTQEENKQDYICFPYINGKIVSHYSERGSYSFESRTDVDNLYFSIRKAPFVLRGTGIYGGYDEVETELIEPRLNVGDSLNVKINIIDSLFGYKTFKNEKLKVKNGKIIILNENRKRSKLQLKY